MAEEQKPNIEKPEAPHVEKPEAPPQEDGGEINEILNHLKGMGVETTDQLQNMQKASQESGRLAQMLGEVKKQNQELQEQLRGMASKPQQTYNEAYDTSESVDLTKLIRSEVGGVLETFWDQKQRQQSEMQMRQLQEVQEIRNNPRFRIVEPKWEKHLQSPAVAQKLQYGQTTLKDEFAEVLLKTYEENMLKMGDQIPTGKMKPPHMEASQERAVPKTSADEETTENLKQITKPDRWQGTDDDISRLVGTALPKDDPFWSR